MRKMYIQGCVQIIYRAELQRVLLREIGGFAKKNEL